MQRGNNGTIPKTRQPPWKPACINTGDGIVCCGGLNRDICSFVKVSAFSLSCPLFSMLWLWAWVVTRYRIMSVCFTDAEGNLPHPGPNMIDDKSKKANICQNWIGFSGFVSKSKRIYWPNSMATWPLKEEFGFVAVILGLSSDNYWSWPTGAVSLCKKLEENKRQLNHGKYVQPCGTRSQDQTRVKERMGQCKRTLSVSLFSVSLLQDWTPIKHFTLQPGQPFYTR